MSVAAQESDFGKTDCLSSFAPCAARGVSSDQVMQISNSVRSIYTGKTSEPSELGDL